MGILIMGMSMHDRYYEPEDDTEEIQERIDYELKNDNYPYSEENILEAIHEDALIKALPTLATLLSQGKTAEAGVVLSSTLYTYWEDKTTREVEENI
jgi:hypothetical protein